MTRLSAINDAWKKDMDCRCWFCSLFVFLHVMSVIDFFTVDGARYDCGSSLGKLSMVCCFYAMILLDINQGAKMKDKCYKLLRWMN
jgi:hypothetical protein